MLFIRSSILFRNLFKFTANQAAYFNQNNISRYSSAKNPFKKSQSLESDRKQNDDDKLSDILADREACYFMAWLQHTTPSEINEAYQQLNRHTLDMIIRKFEIGSPRLAKLFDGLAAVGNIEGIEKINSLLPKKKLNQILYKNSRQIACGIYVSAEHRLDEWNKKIENANTIEEIGELAFFPSDVFYSLVKNNPNVITECESLARKYAEKHFLEPINMIWCYQFINGHRDSSNQLWKEFVHEIPKINYRPITTKASEDNDEKLLYDLIEILQLSATGKLILDGIYFNLLNIHINKNQLNEALKVMNILKDNGKRIHRSTLNELKSALEAAGKQVPFDIIQSLKA